MSTPGEIAIQARLHPSGRWITIPVDISRVYPISAVLDTGAPVSAISPGVEQELSRRGLLQPGSLPRRFGLSELSSQDQELPDLEVAVINRLERLGVDGLLGLDFLTKFEHIHFHTRSLQLVLERH